MTIPLHTYNFYVERMTASQMEVKRLESATQDLTNRYNQLEDVVKNLSDRNGCLECELREAQCREEQLKEEDKVTRAKLETLDEVITGSESKVV